MNYEEVKQEVDFIIKSELAANNETINIAGSILAFLDSIGYDNSAAYVRDNKEEFEDDPQVLYSSYNYDGNE